MTPAPLLVLLTCVVASVSYIGAVTQWALAVMVLPLVVVAGALAALMRARPIAALWTVVLVAGGGGEVVNVLSGNYQGSVARSAGVASLATGLAVVISATRRPALFLLPVAGIVAWALALGAGGRVELVAVVTAALGCLALATVERDSREFLSPPPMARNVVLSVLLLLIAGVFAAQFQLQHDGRPAASPFRGSLATTIQPPTILSLTRHPPPSATQSLPVPAPDTGSARPPHSRLQSLWNALLWAVVALVALLVVALLIRLLWVALAWRRLHRRLVRGPAPPEAGAWAWALAVLDRLGSPLPLCVSPDIAMAHGGEVSEPLRALARTVAAAAFAPPGRGRETGNAWKQAHVAVTDAWDSATRARRTLARLQVPRRVARAH